MAFEKDPNELGTIFVSAGKGNYADTEFFGGRAFPIDDGLYTLENVRGVSKKTGNPFHLIRVVRVEQQVDAQAEFEALKARVAGGDEAPF